VGGINCCADIHVQAFQDFIKQALLRAKFHVKTETVTIWASIQTHLALNEISSFLKRIDYITYFRRRLYELSARYLMPEFCCPTCCMRYAFRIVHPPVDKSDRQLIGSWKEILIYAQFSQTSFDLIDIAAAVQEFPVFICQLVQWDRTDTILPIGRKIVNFKQAAQRNNESSFWLIGRRKGSWPVNICGLLNHSDYLSKRRQSDVLERSRYSINHAAGKLADEFCLIFFWHCFEQRREFVQADLSAP